MRAGALGGYERPGAGTFEGVWKVRLQPGHAEKPGSVKSLSLKPVCFDSSFGRTQESV